MFRTEEITEINFEDGFFDDMIAELEKLRAITPKGNYDAGWNAGVKNCICKLYSFFGHGNVPARIVNGFVSYITSDEDKKMLIFDDLVKDIMKMRISCPTKEEDMVWNSAVQMCLIRLGKFFDHADSLEEILNLFDTGIKKDELKANTKITRPEAKSEVKPETNSNSHDPINHPDYYCDGGIETLDYIMAKKLDFLLGQVVKYVSRAGKKDPAKEIEDLRKARFYLDWKINLLKGKP